MNGLTGVERHLAHAQAMLERGVRPTVDLIVAECGGSRTTAQKALVELWESRLPALLAARHYEDDVPVPVQEAIGTLWREARQQADTAAEQALASAMTTLEGERAEIRGVLSGIEAERQRAKEASEFQDTRIADLQREKDELNARVASMQESLNSQTLTITMLKGDAKEARDALARTQEALADANSAHAVVVAQYEASAAAEKVAHDTRTNEARTAHAAEREALISGHQRAMDALKTAYHDADQQRRVEIDALKTEIVRLGKVAAATAKADAQKIDVLRNEVAALKQSSAVRRPWRRMGAAHAFASKRPAP